MPRDMEKKKTAQRNAYRRKREAQLIAAGIDPSLIMTRTDGKRTIAIRRRIDSSLPEELILEMLPKPDETSEEHRRRRNRLKANFYNSRMNPEQRAERNAKVRAAYEQQAEKLRARKKERYNQDPERHREYGRKYFLKNKEARLAKLLEWAKLNPEKAKAARERWAVANKATLASYSSGYRAQLADASPVWTDWDSIYWIYEEASKRTSITGVKHVVDHIIPLNGQEVCGLHVWWNLRVITETENCRKNNRWSQEEGIAPMNGD